MLDLATRALGYVRKRGVRFALAQIAAQVRPPRLGRFDELAAKVRGKAGLEVGGPSDIFREGGVIPVYPLLGSLDGCNFATQTMWEGRIEAGQTYRFSPSRPPGRQHIGEASNLAGIADASYDVVLSSHCLEHSANPLMALCEWTRVLRPGGTLVVIVPDPRFTFDRRRPVTSFDHLLADHAAGMGENDLTHLDEILKLHDFALDEEADPANFATRARTNLDNRGLHQHVFDAALIERAVRWAGPRPRLVESHFPFHIVVVADKPG